MCVPHVFIILIKVDVKPEDGEKAEILLGINMRDLIIVLYPAPLAENR